MIVYLNGQLVDESRARVSPFDRGFIFGDGVYEGLRAVGGRIVGLDRHIRRMRAGLAESRIDFDPATLVEPSARLLEANGLEHAFVYWQVTRGAPRPGDPVRSRLPSGMAPTAFACCTPLPDIHTLKEPVSKTCAVLRDDRWLRCHVKSISLHGNVLLTMEAAERGADDVIMVRDGLVSEASSANVFVAMRGRIVTPSLDSASMLAGITRDLLIEELPEIEARPVTQAELRAADEVMLAGTITMIASVTALDGRPVGEGRPGPVARRLLGVLVEACERAAQPLVPAVHSGG